MLILVIFVGLLGLSLGTDYCNYNACVCGDTIITCSGLSTYEKGSFYNNINSTAILKMYFHRSSIYYFDFIYEFPKLELISFLHCVYLDCEKLNNISAYLPGLTIDASSTCPGM